MAEEKARGEGSADAIGAGLPQDGDAHTPEEASILAAARDVCETALGPNAEATDRGPGPNRANFEALAEKGLLGLAIPKEYGGLDASGATQRKFTQLLASYCGVTTFTQAQHHGPSRMIANGPNADLKCRLLPDLASGRRMSGISFAHLRRPGPPILRAEPVEGGWRLQGTAPWVTGWGLISQVAFGATLPDGRFLYVWSPTGREEFPDLFANVGPPEGNWGSLVASSPLALCAMNASATVELTLADWFIPAAHRLSESDRETMQRNDRNGVLGATAMPLGCAAAAIRLLGATAEKRPIPAITRATQAFLREWEEVEGQVEEWNGRSGESEFFANAVRVRAWCIELALRAAHAAVTASSGAANLLSHPAQRLLREAMFYTVQAQTHEVMDATLARLERAGETW
ncbi:MAG: Acyl-CoA dehydrogenase [Chthonomonadaceae bacterium]|nr:Acyl-CoA dehydrogenase [Chthonomonadaceae bacterium]